MVSLPFEDGGGRIATKADPALVKALARAFRYQWLLDEGRYASISEMAAAERIERGYLGSLLRLTLLAPDVVQEALNGRHRDCVNLTKLLGRLPMGWAEQRAALTNVVAPPEKGATNRRQTP
jgi:hypothetical protein